MGDERCEGVPTLKATKMANVTGGDYRVHTSRDLQVFQGPLYGSAHDAE